MPDVNSWSLGKGTNLSKAIWEPESHLANTLDVLADYLHHVKAKKHST